MRSSFGRSSHDHSSLPTLKRQVGALSKAVTGTIENADVNGLKRLEIYLPSPSSFSLFSSKTLKPVKDDTLMVIFRRRGQSMMRMLPDI